MSMVGIGRSRRTDLIFFMMIWCVWMCFNFPCRGSAFQEDHDVRPRLGDLATVPHEKTVDGGARLPPPSSPPQRASWLPGESDDKYFSDSKRGIPSCPDPLHNRR